MPLTCGGNPSGGVGPYRPVLRWVQVGVASAGMGLAMVAGSAGAAADPGATSTGADASGSTGADASGSTGAASAPSGVAATSASNTTGAVTMSTGDGPASPDGDDGDGGADPSATDDDAHHPLVGAETASPVNDGSGTGPEADLEAEVEARSDPDPEAGLEAGSAGYGNGGGSAEPDPAQPDPAQPDPAAPDPAEPDPSTELSATEPDTEPDALADPAAEPPSPSDGPSPTVEPKASLLSAGTSTPDLTAPGPSATLNSGALNSGALNSDALTTEALNSEAGEASDAVGSDPSSAEPQGQPEPQPVPPATLAAPEPAAPMLSRPAYPAAVDAPVTWRSIVTDTLSWLGLGAAPGPMVPDAPVDDVLAGLWIGLRRLHYTYFNSTPTLTSGAATEDLDTGIITGELETYDADGDVVTYVVTEAPAHGTVSVTEDGQFVYTPDAPFAETGGIDTFTVAASDTGAANPWHVHLPRVLRTALGPVLGALGFPAPASSSSTTVAVGVTPQACRTDAGSQACAAAIAPKITVHNSSDHTIWVYNLPSSGDYSIDSGFTPISIEKGHSAPVTLAVGSGPVGSPKNRIYIVEGEDGFTLPVSSTSGVDAFNPTAPSEGNSFLNYNFVEYYLYPADGGGYQYTIDTSYIDEWSLPIQYKFDLNGTTWSGAVDGKTYGFSDFDTVASQLKAAGGPYEDLVWSGATPWGPQPPSTVHRIIGPDKVWAAQSSQPASNANMNNTGWVPTSYQDFVQYGSHTGSDGHVVYPFAQNGTQYSPDGNFTFWKNEVDAPASTPYPIALRTAAIHDGFPAANGVYGFFTYPNDEKAGQFTNIPTSVSLDIYVHGSSDGVSDSVIEGGSWVYSSSSSPSRRGLFASRRAVLTGTSATDTFILDSVFSRGRTAPLVVAEDEHGDIVVIDRTALGASSVDIDVVDHAWFLGGGFANYDSQFVYDRSTGYLYYDQDPDRFGYTGVLAKLPNGSADPASTVYVL